MTDQGTFSAFPVTHFEVRDLEGWRFVNRVLRYKQGKKEITAEQSPPGQQAVAHPKRKGV